GGGGGGGLRDREAAFALDRDALGAYRLLAPLQLPGEDYVRWLARLYAAIAPATAIEIGVFRGRTLALFRPPTVAVGVDPAPEITRRLGATTRIVRETSDVFFRSGQPAA